MGVIPHVTTDMLTPGFWTHGQRELLGRTDIERLHGQWRGEPTTTLIHMETYPATVTESALYQMIATDVDAVYRLREQGRPLYTRHGDPLTDSFWEEIVTACNHEHLQHREGQVRVRYAVTVGRISMRLAPTAVGAYFKGDLPRFDRLQETALHTATPVLVLHDSAGGQFAYVQAPNYRGFVQTSDIAETDRETWLTFVQLSSFLLVTGKGAVVDAEGQDAPLEYAARLPFWEGAETGNGHYLIALPKRMETGRLALVRAAIARDAAVFSGNLPCTRKEVVTQAFQLLHEPYGWGDEYDLHDCSSFVMDVYRTVGVDLPRNADRQEALLGIRKVFFQEGAGMAERSQTLRELAAGDLLYMPGHTMMYLGAKGDEHFVIHDFNGYALPNEKGKYTMVSVREVMVSPLGLHLTSKKRYLDELTTGLSLWD